MRVRVRNLWRKLVQRRLRDRESEWGRQVESETEMRSNIKEKKERHEERLFFRYFECARKDKEVSPKLGEGGRIRPKKIDFLQLGHLHVNSKVYFRRSRAVAFAHLSESIRCCEVGRNAYTVCVCTTLSLILTPPLLFKFQHIFPFVRLLTFPLDSPSCFSIVFTMFSFGSLMIKTDLVKREFQGGADSHIINFYE